MSSRSSYRIAVTNPHAWKQSPAVVEGLRSLFADLDELARLSRNDAHLSEFLMSLADLAQAHIADHCGLNIYPQERGDGLEDMTHLLAVLERMVIKPEEEGEERTVERSEPSCDRSPKRSRYCCDSTTE